MITTYDFGTKSFGHASMLIDSIYVVANTGEMIHPQAGPGLDAALKEISEARKRLVVEQEKERMGEPFDYFFIYGHDRWSMTKGGNK